MIILVALVLAGCGTSKTDRARTDASGYPVGGGDYRRDGPHANPPANLASVPDAVPRLEPLASGPNRPYVINGKRYVPDTSGGPYRIKGRASWYGRQFHGRPTSSGEAYDMYAMTAAHPTLPIPSYARVTRTDNGRSIIVRINDRGPFHSGRVIDLSYVAAYKLDTIAHGTGDVVVERIMPEDIGRNVASTWRAPPSAPAPAMRTPQQAPAPEAIASAAASSSLRAATPRGPEPVRTAGLSIPVPSAPISSPASAPGLAQGSAFLQLGAFGEARNAHQLADRIRAGLANVGAIDVVQTGDNVFRVRLGPFSDRNTAVAHVDTVYGQTGIRPYVLAQ